MGICEGVKLRGPSEAGLEVREDLYFLWVDQVISPSELPGEMSVSEEGRPGPGGRWGSLWPCPRSLGKGLRLRAA